jgi:predicted transcriptional regulator
MTTREEARERTEALKRLREEHHETVELTQARLKEQNALRKQIRQAMAEGPKTVPEVVAATHLPGALVMWHITAMKKYNLVAEVGMSGSYYQYQLVEGKEK